MLSGPGPWIAGSAVLAGAAACLRYARREERVRGRAGPAVLHAVAIFLLLAGLRLPPLRAGRPAPPRTAALVDLSASMMLPVRPGARSRLDSAFAVLSSTGADFVLGFGDSVTSPPRDDGIGTWSGGGTARAEVARRSLVAPALRAARRAGASSAVLITDGELEDREEARAEAARLGLAIEEIVVAPPLPRTGIAEARGPVRVAAGDSVRLEVEIRTPAGGAAGEADSVGVTAAGPADGKATARVARPDPGRSTRLTLALPTGPAGSGPEWRPYDIALEPGADPLRPEAAARVWVEVVPASRGAVLLSMDPDWEPGALLPVLERASAGGARGFLMIGEGRWTTVGTRPGPATEPEARRAAEFSDLLVVQGAPADLPAWVVAVAGARPLLLFARGAGAIPGGAGRVGSPLSGEWYPVSPVPSSPVAGLLAGSPAGLDPQALPPVGAPRELAGVRSWTALEVARDRRGDPRPLAVGLEGGRFRRAVVLAEGTWRWAARTGRPREVYRALFSALAGWLLESADREPVALAEVPTEQPGTVRLRVAAGARDLVISARDSTGAEVARDSVPAPGPEATLHVGREGDVRLEAKGELDGRQFLWSRPVRLPGAEEELLGRPRGRSLATGGAAPRDAGRGDGGRVAPPVWPFALAAAALCGEWAWRRRIGLR